MVIRKCNICDRRFKKTEHFKRHERSREFGDPTGSRIANRYLQTPKKNLTSVASATSDFPAGGYLDSDELRKFHF